MNNNYKDMERFLERIKKFALANPNRQIDEKFIYSQLIFLNESNKLVSAEEDWKKIAEKWQYASDGKTYNFQRSGFLVFNRGSLSGNEVKLYLPLTKDYLTNGVLDMEKFLMDNNISHQLKVASVIRNDNIVIRVNSIDDADKVINFALNNSNFSKGLAKVNPFLANNKGIGMAMDNNFSFNSELSKINSYFFQSQKNDLSNFNLANFNVFINKQIWDLRLKLKESNDYDLLDIYQLLSRTTSPNFDISEFYNFANYKAIDKYDSNRHRITDPAFYFEQAIRLTHLKYPQNPRNAILKYLSNGYTLGFTNNLRARDGLVKYVSPDNARYIMKSKLLDSQKTIPATDEELVASYLDNLIYRSSYKEEYEIIKRAYLNTLTRYNYQQAHGALKNLLEKGMIINFTDAYGDRTALETKVLGKNIRQILESNLNLENLSEDYDFLKMVEESFSTKLDL